MSGDLLHRPVGRAVVGGLPLFTCDRQPVDDPVDAAGKVVVLRLAGELDMATAPILAAALYAAVEGGAAGLVLDLTDLSFMDSTGIHVLRRAAVHAGADCPMLLRHPARAVLKVLRVTGTAQLLAIDTDDEPSAEPNSKWPRLTDDATPAEKET